MFHFNVDSISTTDQQALHWSLMFKPFLDFIQKILLMSVQCWRIMEVTINRNIIFINYPFSFTFNIQQFPTGLKTHPGDAACQERAAHICYAGTAKWTLYFKKHIFFNHSIEHFINTSIYSPGFERTVFKSNLTWWYLKSHICAVCVFGLKSDLI